MQTYNRILEMNLPKGQSAFLWGARNTGKSAFLKQHFPNEKYYDLLQTDLYLRLAKAPHLLREELLALPNNSSKLIIIDEVQKVPALLDEVHWLIENTDFYFILCGSSARKLKSTEVNLLGGRAWKYNFFPLVYPELIQHEFDLLKIFNAGLLPAFHNKKEVHRSLKAYIQDYLIWEIQAEGLTRNLPAFSRFLEAMSFSHGQLTNYANIARDCGVDAKTVKEYFRILIDTLLGYFINPYVPKNSRSSITATPKFYLFDVGIANTFAQRNITQLASTDAGQSFEHYICLELLAYSNISQKDFSVKFWRTKTGAEVDFVLNNGQIAIETKISSNIHKTDLKNLISFCKLHPECNAYLVANVPQARKFLYQIIFIP